MTTLCLISAGHEKIWDRHPETGATPAKDAYVGPFYRKCRAYAEMFYPKTWMVFSPLHGFLWPSDLVPENYDVTFRLKRTHPITAERLRVQALEKGIELSERIVLIGGKRYVAMASEVFGDRVEAPLAGVRGNGLMMRMLNQAVELQQPLVEV